MKGLSSDKRVRKGVKQGRRGVKQGVNWPSEWPHLQRLRVLRTDEDEFLVHARDVGSPRRSALGGLGWGSE